MRVSQISIIIILGVVKRLQMACRTSGLNGGVAEISQYSEGASGYYREGEFPLLQKVYPGAKIRQHQDLLVWVRIHDLVRVRLYCSTIGL